MLPHHNTLQQDHNELLLKLYTIKKDNELNLPLKNGFSTENSHSLISAMTFAFQPYLSMILSPKKPDTEPVFYSDQGSFTTDL